ncbi:hypothetical protein C8R48DRAFT_676094 [Suillus tomentosus]|nr:hypothetical protein C8R48DRAFT_676094 [Suillus tomentosus]
MYYTHIFAMAKGKKLALKKPIIRIPARPLNRIAKPVSIDDSTDESFEFPDSPAPSVHNGKRVENLSEANWSTENLNKEDDKPKVDELNDRPDKEPTYGNPTAFTFVNIDSTPFNASQSHKRNFVPQGCLTNKPIDWILARKQKKTKGKARKFSVRVSDTSENEEGNAPRKFTVYVQVWSEAPMGKGAKVSVMIVLWGPCKMDTAHTFQFFKQDIMKAQSVPHKKIADEAGYDTLLDAVKAK